MNTNLLRGTLLLVLMLWLCIVPSNAQQYLTPDENGNYYNPTDGNPHFAEEDTVDLEGVPFGIYAWTIDSRFGTVKPVPFDTIPHGFQNENLTGGMDGSYNYLGNLGSARIGRIFTEQDHNMLGSQFIFARPYDFFLTRPDQLLFTNTKSPFTNITYHKAGSSRNGEDRIRGIFATNVNKRLGLGFKLDYLYGRGHYASQSTAHFNGTLFGSYLGERYQMHTMYYANHLKAAENGGVESDDYVTRPEAFPTRYSTSDMPTRLSRTWNRLNVNTFFLTQRYSVGFEREEIPDSVVASVSAEDDTLSTDSTTYPTVFVPVTSFIHTLRIDHNNRRFVSNSSMNASNSTYFNDFYLPGDSANDFTKNLRIENMLAFELREGFNSWVKSGLRLYAKHEFNRFTLPDEARRVTEYKENYFTVGAQLLKEQGKIFHYHLLGEIRTTGTDWGEFNVEGSLNFDIPMRSDSLRIKVDGFVRNEQPSFYYRHFHARNAWWDNSLDKVFTARVGGTLSYKETQLRVDLQSVQNYTYFAEGQTPFTNSEGMPVALYSVGVAQASHNTQLLAATLNQNFRWGIFNWENEFTYQLSSDQDVFPVPAFTGYSNVYLLFRIAKVLRTEIGGDIRYFTKYYAPTYSPIIGQFCVQDPTSRIKIGGYPIISVYANFHLKRTRFYVMGSHVNYSSGSGFPFLVPHYPLNRLAIQFGVSWNFIN